MLFLHHGADNEEKLLPDSTLFGVVVVDVQGWNGEEYVCNPLLNDLVIDLDDELGIDSTARDSDRSNFPDSFTHVMVNARCRERLRRLS